MHGLRRSSVRSALQTGQVMQAYHKVMTVLTANGLCREMQISPGEVGVSPRNRDGYGVSGPEAHEFLDKIVRLRVVGSPTAQ